MNILFIIIQEIKSIFNKINIILFTLIAIFIFIFPPYNELVLKIDTSIGVIAPMILIIVYSSILNKEYENNTYKYIFTGKFTRSAIIVTKFLSLIIISIILSIICSLLSIIGLLWNGEAVIFSEILNKTLIFICFTLFVGPIAIFISILSRSFVYTLLLLFIMFIDYFNRILFLVANEVKINVLKNVLIDAPFYKAIEGFKIFHYSLRTGIIMVLLGIIILFMDCILIERKDL